jgi:hypothetical protein
MHDLPLKTPIFAEALASSEHWLMLGLCLVLVGSVVGLHYEALERLNSWLPRLRLPIRLRVLVLIYGLMAVHTLEIWIFGAALYGVTLWPELGRIAGADGLVLLDAVYLSTVTYTTVGYGDLTPEGPLRLLLGMESLSGFLLVTWSASFTYLEMQRNWRVS